MLDGCQRLVVVVGRQLEWQHGFRARLQSFGGNLRFDPGFDFFDDGCFAPAVRFDDHLFDFHDFSNEVFARRPLRRLHVAHHLGDRAEHCLVEAELFGARRTLDPFVRLDAVGNDELQIAVRTDGYRSHGEGNSVGESSQNPVVRGKIVTSGPGRVF